MSYFEAWQHYKTLTYDDLPEDVVTIANQCVLDWFGCAAVGSQEPLSEILRGQFGHRSGNCSVIGTDLKTEAATAALLNGASGHALDYDDTGALTGCHSTAPVLPAALAVAQEMGATGQMLITAFVVGVEIEGRIFRLMGSDHYARGWHTTATFGTFGATAAVAFLLGLTDAEFNVAMGLAASHASGVKANFGTMTKPYHPGRAAEDGVICARLAAAGFTANPDAIVGSQGYIGAASNGQPPQAPATTDEWLIRGTLFKYHAACHLTHAAIESVLSLKTQLSPAELSSMTITVNPVLLGVCGIEEPKSGLEGKFSLRGTASLALLGYDTADPETYVDGVISGEDVQSMIPKITVETDKNLSQFQSRVVWVSADQTAHDAFKDLSKPSGDLQAQGEKLESKFKSLCALADVDSDQTLQKLQALADQDAIAL